MSEKTEGSSINANLPHDAGDTFAKGVPPSGPFTTIILHGLRHGLAAFLDLAKVIIPVYFGVALLNYCGVVTLLAHWLRPTMKMFGLPGEAAIVLLTGWFASIYAALGALNALELSPSAITQLGLMLLICHALPMEWVVLQKMGARAARITLMRLVLSMLVGILYALLYREQVAASPVAAAAISPEALPFSVCLAKAALGCVKLLGLILAIIMPLTVISEIARARKVLPRVAHRLAFFLRRFGLGESALMPLLIGLIFGIVYGAGALIALGRTGAVKPADARTVGTFLGICHSMLEDPLLFIAIGGNWFWLIVVRFLLAVILTPLLRRLS